MGCPIRGNKLQPERTSCPIRGNVLLIRENGLHNSINDLRMAFLKIPMSLQGFRTSGLSNLHIYLTLETWRSYISPWFASMTQACPNSKPWNKGLVNFITGNSPVLCWDVHVWFRRFCGFERRTRNLHISCREFSPWSHFGIEPRSLANIRADSLPLLPWCTNKPFCSF